MLQPDVIEYLALLKKSHLLTESQFATIKASAVASTESLTVEVLQTDLIRKDLLTKWQSGQLTRGQTGFVLQQYRLLNPVGRGGMGHVFRARDDRNGAVVAIKVMARKLTADQTLVNRFRREIRATSQLNSPHIIRTLDAGRVGNTDFMVMEFVNGDQLDKVIRRVRVLPVSVACELVRQAAIGLQHAHEKQMVHRDIKPANLIIDWSPDGNGVLKLMDMGLVRLAADETDGSTVTRTGQIMGTPDYMSPEQGWDTASVDIRSDIYSLGCTLFRLLSGRIPFSGDNPLQLLMVRCSRDAPPVRSVRGDIPEVVDAVVRRMTMRDPIDRYQTPGEVAAALAPFCEPLTRESMKRAAQAALAEDDDVIELTAVDSEAELSHDAGYQQFIREVRRGANVDLMTNHAAPDYALENASNQPAMVAPNTVTLPFIDSAPASLTPVPRRPRSRRGQKAGWLAAGTSVIVLAGISLLLLPLREGQIRFNGRFVSDKDEPDPVADVVPDPTSVVKATIEVDDKLTTTAGTLLTIQPRLTVETPPVSGDLIFELGSAAPAAVSIDPESGEIQWDIPKLQTPEDYPLPIRLVHKAGDTSLLVTSRDVMVTVSASPAMNALPTFAPFRLRTGMEFSLSVAATTTVPKELEAVYRISAGQPKSLELDSESARLTWTPTEEDIGRHDISVELFSRARKTVLASADYRLLVIPAAVRIRLPDVPAQRATAGQLLEIPLEDVPFARYSRVLRIGPASGSPAGVSFDSQSSVVRWQIPASVSGRVEIRLRAEPVTSEIELTSDSRTETTIVINVVPPRPEPKIPAADAVNSADAELRDVFRRELLAARTAVLRAELAALLLEKAIDQTAGAADYALLNLAADQAEKSRASDILLAVNRLRCERYQTDELVPAIAIAADVRRNSLSPAQQDLVIEHCVRLAAVAAAQEKWQDVTALLTTTDQLLRNSQGFAKEMESDLVQAQSLATELAKSTTDAQSNKAKGSTGGAADNSNPSKSSAAPSLSVAPGPTETLDVKSREVTRLLSRWQFTDLFHNNNSLSFLQASNVGEQFADSGRSLWSFGPDRIQLTTQPQAGLIGFVDTSIESGRYLVRMSVGAESNASQFVVGAGRDQQLSAFLVTLDQTGPGRIHRLPGGTTIHDAPASSASSDRSHLVEILVAGTQVALRIDGVSAVSTQIPDLTPGRIGLIVPLSRPSPGPKLDIRDIRILMLPDSR